MAGIKDELSQIDVFHKTVDYWNGKSFRGKDLSDILATPLFIFLIKHTVNYKWGKYVYYPFLQMANRFPNLFRKTFKLNTNYKYPQAHAVIIRGLIQVYKKSTDPSLKRLIFNLAEEIIDMRSKDYELLCWGQPFNWYSKDLMRANVPRTTVTSQVASSFLDIFETFNEDKFLRYAEECCEFYLKHLNYSEDSEGDFCFSYTTKDNYHVHNPSMMAAAVLQRTFYHNGNVKYKEMSEKASNYTAKHQNRDGSFYYRGMPDKVKGVIDNYHTGFVLESYQEIKNYSRGDFKYEENLKKGLKFYVDNFFEDGRKPKYRPNKLYPIDIQGCGQSLITLTMCEESEHVSQELIDDIYNFTINRFFNQKGYFYYRYYTDSRVDKNAYIRWGDSWMIRALGLMINN